MAPIPTAYAHRRPTAPDAESVQELAALLARAERPVIVAGSGVYWDDAAKDLAALAERAGVPGFMNGAGPGSLAHHPPPAFAPAPRLSPGQADGAPPLGPPLGLPLRY